MLGAGVSGPVEFRMPVGMPGNPRLPVCGDLLRSLPNVSGSIEQEEDPWRIWSGSERIDSSKSAYSQPVSPMLDLGLMTTLSAGMMVVDDQAASGPRQFT